jgi:RNA polymerase sigma-70 factor (ECF subfamily)
LRVCKRSGALSQLGQEDINEIFGDVCVNILRDDMHKLRAYDPARGARLSSWLGLLAINAAYDYLRQSMRRPALLHLDVLDRDGREQDPLSERAAEGPSALDHLLEKERWVVLERLLVGFSPRDRDFVQLYFRCGLSPEEVAAEMGISIKTVYSKKNKVRTRLLRLAQRRRGAGALQAAA